MKKSLVIPLICACLIFSMASSAIGWDATLTWSPSDNSENEIPQTGWKIYYDYDAVAAQPFVGTGANEGPSPITISDPEALSTIITGLPEDQVVCFGITAINGIEADESFPQIKCANSYLADIFIVQASASSGGTISPLGPLAVAAGDDKDFTTTAYSGYELSSLFLDGVNVFSDVWNGEYSLLSIMEDYTLVAGFVASSGEITLSKKIGVFIPSTGEWYFDLDGDGSWDDSSDRHVSAFGTGLPNPIPVIGDWNKSGTIKVGVFVPSTGEWYLDIDGDDAWDGSIDRYIPDFGSTLLDPIPVVSDWNNSGTIKVGVFVPATGEWYLDIDGDSSWDSSNDRYVEDFGSTLFEPMPAIIN